MNTLYILDSGSFWRFNNEQETYGSCPHQASSLKRETNIKQAIVINKGKYCEWRSLSARCYGRTLGELILVSVLELFGGGLRIEDEE